MRSKRRRHGYNVDVDAIQPAMASVAPIDSFIGGCARCGYNLYGLIDPRCPECGLAFDAGNSWPRRWIEWREEAMRRSLMALLGAACISWLVAVQLSSLNLARLGTWWVMLFGLMTGILLIVAFVVGLVAVAVAGKWIWDEMCGWIARRPGLGRSPGSGRFGGLPGATPELVPELRSILGVIAAILVMCLWLPGVIISPFWLPPVALVMYWLEHRRTRARLAAALLTPYSIDTRRQFASYRVWGSVLSAFTAAGWIGCLLVL